MNKFQQRTPNQNHFWYMYARKRVYREKRDILGVSQLANSRRPVHAKISLWDQPVHRCSLIRISDVRLYDPQIYHTCVTKWFDLRECQVCRKAIFALQWVILFLRKKARPRRLLRNWSSCCDCVMCHESFWYQLVAVKTCFSLALPGTYE